MAKGRGPAGMMGGMNMNNIMKQAQKMQQQMEATQQELENREISVTAGGGAIKVVMTGKKQIKSLELEEEIVDPDDIEMLQDTIISAVNEAIRQVDDMTNNEMGKLTGGMGMPPGLF